MSQTISVLFFDSVKDTVADLHKVGLVDNVILKNIESLCVPEEIIGRNNWGQSRFK